MSAAEIDHLRPILGAMLGRLRSIAPLPSGSSGTSYLVETATGRFVAKAFAPDAQVLLGPVAQFELIGRLAQAGLAPRPAGVHADEHILVTEFVADAGAIAPEQLCQPQNIERLAAALRRLHAVRVAIPSFTPRAYADRYLARIGGIHRLGAEDRDHFAELLSLKDCVATAATTLCHNDLAAENLLFGESVRFIDFDYAVCASPIVDLASIVIMNEFSPLAAHNLVTAYFAGTSPFSESEFAKVQRLMRLLAHFWSLAAQYRVDDG